MKKTLSLIPRKNPLPEGVQHSTPKIIRGDIDYSNKYINVVKLINTLTGSICTGTVISKNCILTASHCFFKQGVRTATPSDIVVEIAAYDAKKESFSSFFMRADAIVTHKTFVPTEHDDIALVFLEKAVPKNIPIAKIYTGDLNKLIQKSGREGLIAHAVGYGLTEGYKQIRISRAVREIGDVRLVELDKKDNLLKTSIDATKKQIACSGDSGGPLFIDVGGQEYIVGVVGWGDYCRTNATYTYVAPYTQHGNIIRDNVNKVSTNAGELYKTEGNDEEYNRIEDSRVEATESEITPLGLPSRIALGAVALSGIVLFRKMFSFED